MKAELISVGTEILLGNIVNTNAAYLSKQCAILGINVYAQSVVGDNDKRLGMLFRDAMSRSDVVILTGCLGVCGYCRISLIIYYIKKHGL